jgi:putative transposase
MADQARSGIPAPGLAFRPHTKKRKHSKAEIAAKLAEADDLVTQGKLQSPDCARARRERHDPASLAQAAIRIERFESDRSDAANTIAELQLENSRLRRLVTDLLLEQMKLEEASQVGERSMRWAS